MPQKNFKKVLAAPAEIEVAALVSVDLGLQGGVLRSEMFFFFIYKLISLSWKTFKKIF